MVIIIGCGFSFSFDTKTRLGQQSVRPQQNSTSSRYGFGCFLADTGPDLVDGSEEYEAEHILDSKYWQGHLVYLVKFQGWPVLSQTVHSHRSCDVPQLRTDFSYLYIVILVYLCFPLSLKINHDTLVYCPL